MQDFYENFYAAMAHSKVHAEFCERVYGHNLCQHGFADMKQLETLINITQLGSQHRALDLGCGNGMITEYLSDCTGAHITGLDYIPEAIRQAKERTTAKVDRLDFRVGDINALDLPDQAFDVIISIDSLYFSSDYTRTIRELIAVLRPGGQMAIYFAHGRVGIPIEEFPIDTIQPDRTPLADALKANGLHFQTWDFTQDDYRLAQRRKAILAELRPQFEAEGILFIYDNRMGDSLGISQFIEEGMHARYLYHVRLP